MNILTTICPAFSKGCGCTSLTQCKFPLTSHQEILTILSISGCSAYIPYAGGPSAHGQSNPQ